MSIAAREAATPTQRAIAEQAHRLFHERGYSGTSIRDIASAAAVDPSIVMRHFHSKAELFARVIGFDAHFTPRLDGPLETLGERLVEYLLAPEHAEMRRTFTVLLRAVDHEAIRLELGQAMSRLMVEELGARLEGADAMTRAWLVSAQLMGLVQAWDAIEHESSTGDGRTRLVRLYGPAIQQLITPGP
ncbi:TetR family transcriptional regulator [Streptomyces cylindrosporus]|uniref:TetR family transcriptional regulator n=1 Tax=Streptomyces cylindrosporus TaxID=2927583 RepID=A0ABS9YLZ6_9ACTN|nr:TetR family transcriptional regulator [Streptomyces cylindrosporus]MCI3276871.1 TetR family transcriptional regulator [Streptomyces cylindrosporus]